MEPEKRPADSVEIEKADKRVHVNCFGFLYVNNVQLRAI